MMYSNKSDIFILCVVCSIILILFGIVDCTTFRNAEQIRPDQSNYATKSHWWMVKRAPVEPAPPCKALENETEPNNCNTVNTH